MNQKINALIGDESRFPLEHRILNIVLLFAIVICLLSGIINYFINMNTTIPLFGGFVLTCLYYLSIARRQYTFPMIITLLLFNFIIIPTMWFFGAGSLGGFPYLIILFSSAIAILLSGLRRCVFICCLIIIIVAVIVIEFKYPSLVIGYSNNTDRFLDIFFGLTMTIIFNALLFVIVLNNYNKEHDRAKDYLTKIEKQHLEIEFQDNLKKINKQLKQEIIERKQAEKLLRESERRYRNLVENINDAIFTLNNQGFITYISTAIEKILLYKVDEVIGKPFTSFIHPEDQTGLLNKFERFMPNVPQPSEFRVFDKSGKVHYVRTSSHPLFEGKQLVGLTCVLVDITLRKKMEDELRKHRDHLEEIVKERTAELKTANEQLQQEIAERKQVETQLKYLATHDYLTNIPNRYSFEESLKKTVAKAKRGKESSLLFIDIDNFKMVNDTKGHTAGDNLLIIVAKTIKENIRESDTLARLGGDEFGVLLEGATVSVARIVAENLRQRIEDSEFQLKNYGCFNLSFSIGVVMIDGTVNSQTLLTLADTALYAAKENGRNRVLLLNPSEEITSKYKAINRLVTQVKNAIKKDKFVLHFQPVVRVEDRQIIHHEVLLRLKGDDGELIYPNTFIPAAERFGLMPNIDRWVIRSSLNFLRQHPDLSIFVNISGTSLSEESLAEYIEEAIARYAIEPSRIGFEITESTAVKDILLAQRWIERLKKLGCPFALDDFGIGFSSFSYLRIMQVDYLKIDGSFILNLGQNPSHRALVEAMNTVAHSLGIKTIAEFVENENNLKILHELKVDFAQGYFLSSPKNII